MCLAETLEELYESYNDRKYVHPDPLEFLYDYDNLKDRELVGIIASLLAYGRVSQILKSVQKVLDIIGEPYNFIVNSKDYEIKSCFKNFKHRFTTEDDISNLLIALKRVLLEYGTLSNCFSSFYKEDDKSVLPALNGFIKILGEKIDYRYNSLISRPFGNSAYKRFNLFLRWMVRKDNVDPGGWDNIPKSKLIVPLDTHMYRICSNLNFTDKKNVSLSTAIEITNCFKEISPNDPVKYDFALTRLGMNRNKVENSILHEKIIYVNI